MINFDQNELLSQITNTSRDKQNMAPREVKTGSLDQWDSLLAQFYDSILEPSLLLPALTRFDRWLGSATCHLFGWDSSANATKFSLMTNLDFVPAGDAYAEYYGAIDPRRKLAISKPVGQTYSCDDYFDQSFVNRNEFYQDLLIPWSVRYVIGGAVYRDEGLDVMFAFNHLVGQPTFSKNQIAAVNRMLPHIERVLRFITRAEKLRAATLAGTVGLEAMGQAVVVVDRRNFITFSNAPADALIENHLVFQTANQRLEVTTRGNSELSACIERVRTLRQPESLTIRVARLSAQPERAFYVTVIPISPGPLIHTVSSQSGAHASWATSSSGIHNTFSAADLMIIISSAGTERTPSPRQLVQWFGFSPAEAKLTQALVAGLSLEEYATESHVSVVTVRNQLRGILQKSGYRRQQDLVRALAKLPTSDIPPSSFL